MATINLQCNFLQLIYALFCKCNEQRLITKEHLVKHQYKYNLILCLYSSTIVLIFKLGAPGFLKLLLCGKLVRVLMYVCVCMSAPKV